MSSGSYAAHQNIVQEIGLALLIEFGMTKVLWFERHVGLFYTKRRTPIQIGRKGQADIYFIINVVGYPCHVEVEVKSGEADQSKEQKAFQKAIMNIGGLYILARNAEDVISALYKKWPELRK